MKSSEKISKVSAELNVKYETVQGLTYKKKVQATSSEDPQHHFTAVHFVQNTCTDYLDCTILCTADIRQLSCSHWVSNIGARMEALITKLHAAGSII